MSSLPAGDARPTVEALAGALRGSFPGDLGIEPLEATPTFVRGRLVVDRRHLHPGGYAHGGVWVAFADSVAAWGTMLNLSAGESFTTSELKVNVFAAAKRRAAPRRQAHPGVGGPDREGGPAGRELHLHPDGASGDGLAQCLAAR
jgi:acyl-coenzyme A thioesterase PaaI-like protein